MRQQKKKQEGKKRSEQIREFQSMLPEERYSSPLSSSLHSSSALLLRLESTTQVRLRRSVPVRRSGGSVSGTRSSTEGAGETLESRTQKPVDNSPGAPPPAPPPAPPAAPAAEAPLALCPPLLSAAGTAGASDRDPVPFLILTPESPGSVAEICQIGRAHV